MNKRQVCNKKVDEAYELFRKKQRKIKKVHIKSENKAWKYFKDTRIKLLRKYGVTRI